ncbi:MAG: glycosyltransferase family 4 protein [Zoogloeaceae bacterium]|nr:glycosyltransferase family 4 protein [Zoogloeaceae bacterium]
MANQCEQLARLLRTEGVAVEVVRNNPDYRPQWVGRVPVLRAFARLLPYLFALWREAGRAEVMHVLANSGWAWHLFAAPVVWIGQLRGCPVIINYRGGHADTFFSRAPAHVFRALRRASARVTPSSFLQRVFAQYGLDAEVVPNIIDLSRFKPAPLREFGQAPHLIVTRNLEPIYDIATAIKAFAEVRKVFGQARMTVAGTGPELERLVALGESLSLASALSFSGRIDNADIPALYASADCMLNPSTVDNMPISILEALASGVPVVSTDAGGIPDMVEHGVSALLVPIGKPDEMARETIRILSDRSLAETQRAAGLAEVARYAWPRVREQWFAVYRRVAAGRSSHSAAATPAGKAT